jgi:hypothetical protein
MLLNWYTSVGKLILSFKSVVQSTALLLCMIPPVCISFIEKFSLKSNVDFFTEIEIGDVPELRFTKLPNIGNIDNAPLTRSSVRSLSFFKPLYHSFIAS